MKRILGLMLSILGAGVGVIGYAFYDGSSHVIQRGESFFGTGWLFEKMSEGDAHFYLTMGVFAMVLGGIFVILGLGIALEGKNKD